MESNDTKELSELINGNSRNVKYCPRVWDEALCWPPTPPNTTSKQHCPNYVNGFLRQGKLFFKYLTVN